MGNYSSQRFLFDVEKNHQTERCDRNRKYKFGGGGWRLAKKNKTVRDIYIPIICQDLNSSGFDLVGVAREGRKNKHRKTKAKTHTETRVQKSWDLVSRGLSWRHTSIWELSTAMINWGGWFIEDR